MALAGHAVAVSISADDVTYNEIDGINDVSFGPTRELLESTDFKDTSGARTRFAGLKDGAISLSGQYESADTAQAAVRTAWENGTDCYVKILWNGATGHKVKTLVENFEIKAAVDGAVEFTSSHQFNGASSAV